MKNIKVELLHATPLWIAAQAIRRSKGTEHLSDSRESFQSNICPVCNDKLDFEFDDGHNDIWCNNCKLEAHTNGICGHKDRDLIHRVGCKFKHESVLELVWFAFDIDDISRALLQEWSRTRIGFSQTVRSSRYTLQELKEEQVFNAYSDNKRVSKYCCLTESDSVNESISRSLEHLRQCIKQGISNDVSKYVLPEAFRTSLTCSFNLRALRHMFQLRTAKSALAEYRHLAHLIYNAIPEEYHYLLKDCIIEPDPLENQSC